MIGCGDLSCAIRPVQATGDDKLGVVAKKKEPFSTSNTGKTATERIVAKVLRVSDTPDRGRPPWDHEDLDHDRAIPSSMTPLTTNAQGGEPMKPPPQSSPATGPQGANCNLASTGCSTVSNREADP